MRTRKLKIGDQIQEQDEFSIINYVVNKIVDDKAIASAFFEGKTYFTAYRVKFKDPDKISPYLNFRSLELPTTRKLISRKRNGYTKESTSDNQ